MKKRLFLACDTPVLLRNKLKIYIGEIKKNNILPKLKWTKLKDFHITLYFLGNIDVQKISIIINKCSLLSRFFLPIFFEAESISVIPSINHPKMIWYKFKENKDFTAQVIKIYSELKSEIIDIPDLKHEITPHITLVRFPKKYCKNINNIYYIPHVDSNFVSRSWCLFESILTSEGSIYKKNI